jgi:hypothetical protein
MSEILILHRHYCKGEWTKQNFLRSYNRTALQSDILSVDYQFKRLRMIKETLAMDPYHADVNRLVSLCISIMAKMPVQLIECTTAGLSSIDDCTKFMKDTMEEILLEFVYESLPSRYEAKTVNP